LADLKKTLTGAKPQKERNMSRINYYLRKNPLATSEENQFMACMGKKDTLRQPEVVKHMMIRNTTVSRQDILIVLDLLKETITELVKDGFPVIMDLFKVRAGIRGGFSSLGDEFDENRHKLVLNLNASSTFKKEITDNGSVEKTSHLYKKPEIGNLFDYGSRSYSTQLRPGSLVVLEGRNMKPQVGDPQILLRLEGMETWIAITKIHDVVDQKILFSLPEDLESGRYTIKLVKKQVDETVSTLFDKALHIT